MIKYRNLLRVNKYIDIQDILKPSETGQSLRVVVDGPPGNGKTTLCCKIINMWTKGELMNKSYNLVIYCPLKRDKIAQASECLDETHGERLLVIFYNYHVEIEIKKEERTPCHPYKGSVNTTLICTYILL